MNRVKNPGYKDTKSAFADYAAAMERKAAPAQPGGGERDVLRSAPVTGMQSAKADFVVL
jgi:hypothetical protein